MTFDDMAVVAPKANDCGCNKLGKIKTKNAQVTKDKLSYLDGYIYIFYARRAWQRVQYAKRRHSFLKLLI